MHNAQIGDVFNQLRLARQRFVNGHQVLQSFDDEEGINETLAQLIMVGAAFLGSHPRSVCTN